MLVGCSLGGGGNSPVPFLTPRAFPCHLNLERSPCIPIGPELIRPKFTPWEPMGSCHLTSVLMGIPNPLSAPRPPHCFLNNIFHLSDSVQPPMRPSAESRCLPDGYTFHWHRVNHPQHRSGTCRATRAVSLLQPHPAARRPSTSAALGSLRTPRLELHGLCPH